jgi:Predicted membrane protein
MVKLRIEVCNEQSLALVNYLRTLPFVEFIDSDEEDDDEVEGNDFEDTETGEEVEEIKDIPEEPKSELPEEPEAIQEEALPVISIPEQEVVSLLPAEEPIESLPEPAEENPAALPADSGISPPEELPEIKKEILPENPVTEPDKEPELKSPGRIVNDNLEKQLLSDLRKSFSLNDRFRFQKELFNGDPEKMNQTLIRLNECRSLAEAWDYLESELKWSSENDTVSAFKQLLEKRFS